MNKQLFFSLLLIPFFIFTGCRKNNEAPGHPSFPTLSATSSVLVIDSTAHPPFNLTEYLEIYTGDAPLTKAIATQAAGWRPCGNLLTPDTLSKTPDRWFRFTTQNKTADTIRRLVWFSNCDYVEMDTGAAKPEQGGNLVALRDWSYPPSNYCLQLALLPTEKRTFFLRCNQGNTTRIGTVQFMLKTIEAEKNFELFEIRSRTADTAFLFFYLGFLFFCLIYFLAHFFYRGNEKMLIVYSLYILFTLLYSFRDLDKHYFLQTTFPAFNGINIWGEAMFSYLCYIFYSLFVIYLLDLKRQQASLFRFIIVVVGIIAALLICDIVLRISGHHQLALAIFLKARNLLFPVTIVYFLFTLPFFSGHYYKYFLYGTLFVGLGNGVNLLVHQIRDNPHLFFHETISSRYGFWGNPVNYARLGVIIEVLFFSLGFEKKMRMAFVQAVLQQDTAIETRFYTHEVKSGLYTLGGKLDKASSAARFLDIYRNYLLKALAVMKSDKAIALSKEIDMARAYFILRQEEDDRFAFNFINQAYVPTAEILIPAGLLIPFIQNFFDHAVTGNSDRFLFSLLLYTDKKKIMLLITDNGKGFDKAGAYNKSGSHGLDIASKKIHLYNTLSGSKIDFTVGNDPSSGGACIKIINLPKKGNHDKGHFS